MPMDHELLARSQLDRHNVARHLGGKGNFAGVLVGTVLGHEQAAAAGHPLQGTKESAASAHLRMRRHLDRAGHPRELAAL